MKPRGCGTRRDAWPCTCRPCKHSPFERLFAFQKQCPCRSWVFVHVLSFLKIWSSCKVPFWIFHEHFREESFIEKLLLLRQAASCSRGDLAFHDCTILSPVSIRMAFQWVATRAPSHALCSQERNHQWEVQRLFTLGWFVYVCLRIHPRRPGYTYKAWAQEVKTSDGGIMWNHCADFHPAIDCSEVYQGSRCGI